MRARHLWFNAKNEIMANIFIVGLAISIKKQLQRSSDASNLFSSLSPSCVVSSNRPNDAGILTTARS
jgi:hypothetical protein